MNQTCEEQYQPIPEGGSFMEIDEAPAIKDDDEFERKDTVYMPIEMQQKPLLQELIE